MECTKQEALMVLATWFEECSPLLLNFKATPTTETIRLKGRIAQLETDSLLFSSRTASLSVVFDQATFEYEEGFLMGPAFRKEMSDPTCCIKLRLSLCQTQLAPNDAATQSLLSLTKALY